MIMKISQLCMVQRRQAGNLARADKVVLIQKHFLKVQRFTATPRAYGVACPL